MKPCAGTGKVGSAFKRSAAANRCHNGYSLFPIKIADSASSIRCAKIRIGVAGSSRAIDRVSKLTPKDQTSIRQILADALTLCGVFIALLSAASKRAVASFSLNCSSETFLIMLEFYHDGR
jgi:hypothetical protein